MSIQYSDGEGIENTILKYIEEAPDRAAATAIAQPEYESWPVRYHLSPERANLLRHLDFEGLDVLELGAGMGAISRWLAEKARSLTLVEGTERRLSAAKSRLKDLPGWEAYSGNIVDVALEKKFDVVTLIGVMEYSELYVTAPEGETPFSHLLKKALSHLKPGGVLIVAIENRLGLKYWSGSAEDHTGKLFDGVCGYPARPTPRTFSRQELLALLARVGLAEVEEQYPFPDYKIPNCVLSKSFVEREPAVAADLAASRPYMTYGSPQVRYFPALLAARSLADANLLPEFANSFLFLASPEKDSPILKRLLGQSASPRALAWHYALERRLPVKTTFFEAASGVSVGKAPLNEKTPSALELKGDGLTIRLLPETPQPLLPGVPLKAALCRAAYYEDWKEYEESLLRFLRWSIQKWKQSGQLKGRALDAVFTNAMANEDPSSPYSLFDLEWELEGPMPLTWFILRNVLLLAFDENLYRSTAPFRNFGELYERICEALSLPNNLSEDIEHEAQYQALALFGDKSAHRARIQSALGSSVGGCPYPRSPHAEYSYAAQLRELRHFSSDIHARYEAVVGSVSYKLSRGVIKSLLPSAKLRQSAKKILAGLRTPRKTEG